MRHCLKKEEKEEEELRGSTVEFSPIMCKARSQSFKLHNNSISVTIYIEGDVHKAQDNSPNG